MSTSPPAATVSSIITARTATTTAALQLFDASPAVGLDFMIGRWKGFEVRTGHPMDGLLDITGWYGKDFISAEEVHPLLFKRINGGVYSVNPRLLPMNLPVPRIKLLGWLMWIISPLIQTKKGKARMRMVEYRGKVTACMVYDHKAIIDAFAKINDHTLIGVMDYKGDKQPYIFVLERVNS